MTGGHLWFSYRARLKIDAFKNGFDEIFGRHYLFILIDYMCHQLQTNLTLMANARMK